MDLRYHRSVIDVLDLAVPIEWTDYPEDRRNERPVVVSLVASEWSTSRYISWGSCVSSFLRMANHAHRRTRIRARNGRTELDANFQMVQRLSPGNLWTPSNDGHTVGRWAGCSRTRRPGNRGNYDPNTVSW